MSASNTLNPRQAAQAANLVAASAATELPAPAWWRVGMVWLVLGGPAVVVVAAIATAVVAYRGADPVLTDAPTARQAAQQPGPQIPAMQGRNHAATPPAAKP